MKKYTVTGMSCAACSARVEKAALSVDGVSSCSVNLLAGSMTVEGDAASENIISAVTAAGYGCIPENPDKKTADTKNEDENRYLKESKELFSRLAFSLGFLFVLMYFSMGHNMLGLPLPSFFDGNPAAVGLVQLLCCIAVMIIGKNFFISGVKSILRLSPNMDALVAVGSGAAFIYSTAVLFLITAELSKGNPDGANQLLHGMYFESSAMILALITVGKSLEARSKAKTGDALRSLKRLMPEYAAVIRDGNEITVKISDMRVGDMFVVRPGEQIPVDGTVLEGSSAVNEAAITGESVPAEKNPGDTVTGATLNLSGFIKCRAEKVGNETVLSKIIETVSNAGAGKAPIARTADKIAAVFVPAVMAIALVTAVVWILLGQSFGFALARAVSVLVISCPCSLGLATPVAIMVGSGVGAKNGILFKEAKMLELCGRTDTVVLDKTGTVTSGDISVTGIFAFGCSADKLLSTAYTLEKMSEHPLAKAVVSYCEKNGTILLQGSDFSASTGSGVSCRIGESTCFAGKPGYLESNGITVPFEAIKKSDEISLSGHTPLFFSENGKFIGIISVCDTVRPDSKDAVSGLYGMGLDIVLLSGDNEAVTKSVAQSVGIKNAIHGAMPETKAETVEKLRQNGKVAMIGDGINDAPALALADVGIAIGTGTDIARDTAGVILVNGDLTSALNAIRLSKSVLRNIKENLFWASFYNCIGIPVAAAALSPLGITLSPMIGALAMGLSSFCVVSNALRLNSFRAVKSDNGNTDSHIYTEVITEEINYIPKTDGETEVQNMEKIFKVDGMMCHHCENHIKKAVGAIDGVVSVTASHTEGTVTVVFSKEIDDATVVKAITDEGYEVIS